MAADRCQHPNTDVVTGTTVHCTAAGMMDLTALYAAQHTTLHCKKLHVKPLSATYSVAIRMTHKNNNILTSNALLLLFNRVLFGWTL